jgi:hypothetical protein
MNEELDYSLHLKAGLVDTGDEDEDGNTIWIGSDKQWDTYIRMSDAEPDEAKESALRDL